MDTGFSIDMLLRWSKEVSLETKTSSRQRRDISIEINVIRRCTPAECYVGWRGINRGKTASIRERCQNIYTPKLYTPLASENELW